MEILSQGIKQLAEAKFFIRKSACARKMHESQISFKGYQMQDIKNLKSENHKQQTMLPAL